jgi:hypothetical protein
MEAIYYGINTYGRCLIQLGSSRIDIRMDPIEGLVLCIDDDGKVYNFTISIDGSYEDPLPSGNLSHWVSRLAQDWAKFCETL